MRVVLLVAAVGSSILLLLIVLIVLLGPVSAWLGGSAVEALQGKDKVEALNSVRDVMLKGAAGAIGAIALMFTARTYSLSREGHVTDRYSKAIEHLGAEQPAQRLGGVFALERIMRDSKKDHTAVVDVLSAFVREQKRNASASEAEADVKAALTVLGRRPPRPDREFDRIRLGKANLRKTLLRNARLDCAVLRGAYLECAHWEGTSLVGAKMGGANLTGADLDGANLRHASLRDAVLERTKLRGAKLDHAILTGVNLKDAELDGASLTSAHLAGARDAPPLTDGQIKALHCSPADAKCSEKKDDRSGPCGQFEP